MGVAVLAYWGWCSAEILGVCFAGLNFVGFRICGVVASRLLVMLVFCCLVSGWVFGFNFATFLCFVEFGFVFVLVDIWFLRC